MRSVCAALAFWLTASAVAQPYPSKPVRIISPFPPGQATDIMARLVAEHLARSLGQPFLVENRAGAGGALGTEAAAKAAPDGYTLVMGTIGPLAISPALYSKLAYDPVRDFAPIANLGLTPQTLVVSASSNPRARKARRADAISRSRFERWAVAPPSSGAGSGIAS